jgi:hypothetical protein
VNLQIVQNWRTMGVVRKVRIDEKNMAHFEDGTVDYVKMLLVSLVPLNQAIRVLD